MAKRTEKPEQAAPPQPQQTATTELTGFGMRHLGQEKWEAFVVSSSGKHAPLGKKPESKARALARLVDAIHEAYLNRHAAKKRAAA